MPRQHGRLGCIAMGAALFATAVASAEILYLREGGSVEGEVQEINETGYRVRTIYGVIVVPFESVTRREESSAAVTQYDQKLRNLEDTAAANFELAQWCEQQGMKAERKRHLQRAMELDADYEPARTALGFVRVNGVWIDGRTAIDKPGVEKSDKPPKPGKKPAKVEESDEDKMVAAIQLQYTRRIRAIRTTYLDATSPDLIAEGKKRIQEIQDPLAILPLSKILSEGSVACRQSLVDMLARFPQDEATLNLAAVALLDKDDGVRTTALSYLTRRDDPRIPAQFRKALFSDNDRLIRRAAIALGLLKTTGAVPDLIEVLTAARLKRVEVPIQGYFGSWGQVFNNPTSLQIGRSVNVNHKPMLGVATAGSFPLPATEMQTQNVTMFRTEVLEALVAITGVNHGFDAAKWRRWYEERKP